MPTTTAQGIHRQNFQIVCDFFQEVRDNFQEVREPTCVAQRMSVCGGLGVNENMHCHELMVSL